MSRLNRRECLTGLAAAAAAAITAKPKVRATMKALAVPLPVPPAEDLKPATCSYGPADELRPINPRDDPYAERCFLLAHALRRACRNLVDAHEVDGPCGELGSACYCAEGALWFLEVLESSFEGELAPWWHSPFDLADGEPASVEEAAERLQLSGTAIVQAVLDEHRQRVKELLDKHPAAA